MYRNVFCHFASNHPLLLRRDEIKFLNDIFNTNHLKIIFIKIVTNPAFVQSIYPNLQPTSAINL